jgi:hypothetical protein
MLVRHLTAAANIDSTGWLIDPGAVRHGIVVAGRVAELAGPVERLTHLNSDFDAHDLAQCLVAERLEVGAAVLRGPDGHIFASARDDAYQPLGRVDLTKRGIAWRAAIAARRSGR